MVNLGLNQAGLATRGRGMERAWGGAERRDLRASSGLTGIEESIAEVEVAPFGGTEPGGDDDIRQGRMPGAGVELAQVHRLQDRVERAMAPWLCRLGPAL